MVKPILYSEVRAEMNRLEGKTRDWIADQGTEMQRKAFLEGYRDGMEEIYYLMEHRGLIDEEGR